MSAGTVVRSNAGGVVSSTKTESARSAVTPLSVVAVQAKSVGPGGLLLMSRPTWRGSDGVQTTSGTVCPSR